METLGHKSSRLQTLEVIARSVQFNGSRFRMDRGHTLPDGSTVTLLGSTRRGGRLSVRAGDEVISLHRAHELTASFDCE